MSSIVPGALPITSNTIWTSSRWLGPKMLPASFRKFRAVNLGIMFPGKSIPHFKTVFVVRLLTPGVPAASTRGSYPTTATHRRESPRVMPSEVDNPVRLQIVGRLSNGAARAWSTMKGHSQRGVSRRWHSVAVKRHAPTGRAGRHPVRTTTTGVDRRASRVPNW